jgi:WD40 repeat protein
LASASEDYSVFLWNLEKRDVVFLVGDNGPIVKQYVAFASGSAKIAIGEGETYDENSSVFVIDLDTGKEIFRQRLKENDCVCGLALSADGTSLVYGTAPWGGGRGDAVLHRLNLTEQRENWNVVFENAHFNQILFCRGEQQLIATAMLEKDDFESAVYVIDATSGEVESTYSSKDISLSIALSPTENLIACAHDGGQVELMRLPNFLLEKRLVEQPGEREGLCCVTFSPDSKLVVVGGAMPQLRVLER